MSKKIARCPGNSSYDESRDSSTGQLELSLAFTANFGIPVRWRYRLSTNFDPFHPPISKFIDIPDKDIPALSEIRNWLSGDLADELFARSTLMFRMSIRRTGRSLDIWKKFFNVSSLPTENIEVILVKHLRNFHGELQGSSIFENTRYLRMKNKYYNEKFFTCITSFQLRNYYNYLILILRVAVKD